MLLSCVLIFSNSLYRQSIYLTSANSVSSTLNSGVGEVTGYFALKSRNASLEQRVARLEAEVLNSRRQIAAYRAVLADSLGTNADMKSYRFDYIMAPVITSSTHRKRNYITVEKGTADGVRPGMGVVDHNGLVGVVNVVGLHTARIISVLNDAQKFSVKLKGTDFVGTLVWKGNDPHVAYVEEIPRHVRCHLGDSIVTSGFSTSFPGGIPVGIVMAQVRGDDDNYFTLKVRLASDLGNLRSVSIIRDIYAAELDTLANYDLK